MPRKVNKRTAKKRAPKNIARIQEHEIAALVAVVLTIAAIFFAVYFIAGESLPFEIEIPGSIKNTTSSQAGEPEPASGFQDKTILWFTNLRQLSDGNEVTVNVVIADNNNEGDGDGGKIRLENAEITSIDQVDWEQDCEANNTFDYECIRASPNGIQWFDFVFSDQDSFRFTIKFYEDSALVLEEAGGMECGAYFQTAQAGAYTGYPDGTGGPGCAAEKTFVGKHSVSQLGGFPVRIPLEG